MNLRLKGRKAILAGASRGIGFATARALAEEGCDIAISARDAAGVDAAIASLKSFGGKMLGDALDLSDADKYRAWVSDAAARLGGCDVFIPFPSGGSGAASEQTWKAAFDVDLMGTFRGVEAALPYLERSDAAAIVSISSIAALEDFFGPQPYNAIKAALINYSSALSQQLAPKGIRVNTVSPGPVFIEGGAWDRIKQTRPEVYQSTVAKVPMGRMGEADEVARAIAFVASPACRFMTGANLVIDGGFTRRVQY